MGRRDVVGMGGVPVVWSDVFVHLFLREDLAVGVTELVDLEALEAPEARAWPRGQDHFLLEEWAGGDGRRKRSFGSRLSRMC